MQQFYVGAGLSYIVLCVFYMYMYVASLGIRTEFSSTHHKTYNMRFLKYFSQVEIKAVWLGQKEKGEGVSVQKSKVDRVMGVKKPVFKKQYHPTKLNSSYVFHSISMMMVGVGKPISLIIAEIFPGEKNFFWWAIDFNSHFSSRLAILYNHCLVVLCNCSIFKITRLKNFVCLLPKWKSNNNYYSKLTVNEILLLLLFVGALKMCP